MAKNKGRPENLRTPTTEIAREIGSKGGKKSAIVRKERRLLSQIYKDFLQKQVGESGQTGEELLEDVMAKVLDRNDSASVSLMKEIREATEGNSVNLNGNIAVASVDTSKISKEKREVLVDALIDVFTNDNQDSTDTD
jgi:hypothetical protein